MAQVAVVEDDFHYVKTVNFRVITLDSLITLLELRYKEVQSLVK